MADDLGSPEHQAELAQQILDNPLFNTIMGELDAGAVEVWRRSTSPGQREEQWHMVVALQAIHAKLTDRLDRVKMLADQARRKARTMV